jgi:hypothetical protein
MPVGSVEAGLEFGFRQGHEMHGKSVFRRKRRRLSFAMFFEYSP